VIWGMRWAKPRVYAALSTPDEVVHMRRRAILLLMATTAVLLVATSSAALAVVRVGTNCEELRQAHKQLLLRP
jgi:hypothetical protein